MQLYSLLRTAPSNTGLGVPSLEDKLTADCAELKGT